MTRPPARRRRSVSRPGSGEPLDRYALYELCAQSPARDARILQALHGGEGRGSPRVLGEDCSAAAALSRAWISLSPRHRAIAVDHDADALAHAPRHPRLRLVQADVLDVSSPVDLVALLNFSIGEWHERRPLLAYLRHVRRRLRRGGCFICDLYGGVDALRVGRSRRSLTTPAGRRIVYTWDQLDADLLTGRVHCAMHFNIQPSAGGEPQTLRHAFTYHWRLWSIPELREALREAGFSQVNVFNRTPDAIDHTGAYHMLPVENAAEVGDSFNLYIVARD